MKKIFIVFLFLSFLVYSNERINVLTTILPYAGIIENIGRNKVNVIVLVPPGAEPHTYEPKPLQLKEVSKSIIYFKVGSNIEFESLYLSKISKLNKNMKIFDTSKGIKILKEDPHIWVSLKNLKIIAKNILEGLCEVDKKNEKFYRENFEKYVKNLDQIDKEIEDKLKDKRGKKFIVFHPAFGYFANDYGLIQIPIQLGHAEPGPKDIERLIKTAKENKIKIVITEPEFSPKTASIIAKEIKGKVISVDPLSRDIIETIKKLEEAMSE